MMWHFPCLLICYARLSCKKAFHFEKARQQQRHIWQRIAAARGLFNCTMDSSRYQRTRKLKKFSRISWMNWTSRSLLPIPRRPKKSMRYSYPKDIARHSKVMKKHQKTVKVSVLCSLFLAVSQSLGSSLFLLPLACEKFRLRSRRLAKMLTERIILDETEDRLMIGSKPLLCKYTLCQEGFGQR